MNSHRPKQAHHMELTHCKILLLVHATDSMMAVASQWKSLAASCHPMQAM